MASARGRKARSLSPGAARLLLAAYLVVPVVLVLGPLPIRAFTDTVRAVNDVVRFFLGQGVTVDKWDVEKASNVLLFIPIGALLLVALPRRRWWEVVVLCFVASAIVELLQYAVLSGRYASVLDVVLNTAGAALGALLGRRLR